MQQESQLDPLTPEQAKSQAQLIAFSPIMFQAVRYLRSKGILAKIHEAREISLAELQASVDLSSYALDVLIEAGITSNILLRKDDKLRLTKTGFFILRDELTQANMDFVHDVCYQGMFYLGDSLEKAKPVGLEVFGQWPTIYDALTALPAHTQKSWLKFDHFYSDQAFPEVLPVIFAAQPRSILDVGGNTGRFALSCVRFASNVHVAIVDLPGQLELLAKEINDKPEASRISGFAMNLLDHSQPLPYGYDAIWMSQFLDCFGEDDILQLLIRAADALALDGHLYILEPFIDCQEYPAATHSLVMTSLYFTAMANGKSRMYRASQMIELAAKAGLSVVSQHDRLGGFHTLLCLQRASRPLM